jgi:predicted acetyltransferase
MATKRSKRGPTIEQAEERIAELRLERIGTFSGAEDLDRAVDADIRVSAVTGGHRLALMVGELEVSWLTVVDFRQRIGRDVVRMGGIACVGTHRDHRFRGYSRRVLQSSLYWMRSEGYDTAMLYGIPSYYPKFGYAQAFPCVSYTLAVRDAERAAAAGHRFVRFDPARHLRAVLAMYDANNAARTGTTLRPPKAWQPFRQGMRWGSKAVCLVAVDAAGRPAGYIVRHDEPFTAIVIEAGFADPAVMGDLVRQAARWALGQRLENIQFLLPADDELMDFCKPLAIKMEVNWRAQGGAQVRMINVPTALSAAAGELGSRMAGRGELTIRTNLDDVRLGWSAGKLTVGPPRRGGPQARMPQWALAQLLYGYRGVAALAREGAVDAGPQARQALAALAEMFPVRPQYHYLVDRF